MAKRRYSLMLVRVKPLSAVELVKRREARIVGRRVPVYQTLLAERLDTLVEGVDLLSQRAIGWDNEARSRRWCCCTALSWLPLGAA